MNQTMLPRIETAETPLDQLTFRIREIEWHPAPKLEVRTEVLEGNDADREWRYWGMVLGHFA